MNDAELIEHHIRTKGVTRCPPAVLNPCPQLDGFQKIADSMLEHDLRVNAGWMAMAKRGSRKGAMTGNLKSARMGAKI